MNIESIKNDFIKAKSETKEVYFKNLISKNPDWSSFVSAINNKYNNPEKKHVESGDKRFIVKEGVFIDGIPQTIETDILIYNKMDLQVWNVLSQGPDDRVNGQEFIPESKEFTDIFTKVIGTTQWGIKSLVNLVGNESYYSPHKDVVDVLSWHCIGTVTYKIYDGVSSDQFEVPLNVEGRNFTEYNLSPGDVIFIPKGVIHEVIVDQPRATLIMNFHFQNLND
jgi:hypothetical protein